MINKSEWTRVRVLMKNGVDTCIRESGYGPMMYRLASKKTKLTKGDIYWLTYLRNMQTLAIDYRGVRNDFHYQDGWFNLSCKKVKDDTDESKQAQNAAFHRLQDLKILHVKTESGKRRVFLNLAVVEKKMCEGAGFTFDDLKPDEYGKPIKPENAGGVNRKSGNK